MKYLKLFEELNNQTYRNFYTSMRDKGYDGRANNALNTIWDKLIEKYYKPEHLITYIVYNDELRKKGFEEVKGYPVLSFVQTYHELFDIDYSIRFVDNELNSILEHIELPDNYFYHDGMIQLGSFNFHVLNNAYGDYIMLNNFNTLEDNWFGVKNIQDFLNVVDWVFRESSNYPLNVFNEYPNQNQEILQMFNDVGLDIELSIDFIINAFETTVLDYV